MARVKNEFIGLRTTSEQRRKLARLARLAGQPGNMSAGLRWWIDKAPSGEGNELATGERGQKAEALHDG
jgi:hypothetical protein